MKRTNLLVMILAVIFITSTAAAQIRESVRGNHNVVKKERTTQPFTGIRVSTGIDVFLKQGNNESITVEADENLHEYIVTEVKNGVLHIYSDANIRDAEMKRAYVTINEVEFLGTTSAGDIVAETPIKADKLELTASSAGSIKLEANANEINVDISSSGDITISGVAEVLDCNLSSAGDLNAFDLKVKEADVSVSSAGDADVNVSEKITARASSAGDINYMGNPKYVDAHSSSAGSIRRR